MKLLEIKIKNTRSDYSAYAKSFLKDNNPLFKQYILLVVLLFSVVLGMQDKIHNILVIEDFKFPETLIDSNKIFASIYYLLILTVLLFLLRYLIMRATQKRVEFITMLSREKKFELTEDELIIDRGGIVTKVKYNLIYNCKMTDKYCYLYINPEAPYIIPHTIENYTKFIKILSDKSVF